VGSEVYGALALSFVLVSLGSLIGDSMVGALLAPIVFALFVFCMSRVPLRTSLMALMALGFCVETADDAMGGLWKGPFHTFGVMMTAHLNTVDRKLGFTSWMAFSGIDLLLVALAIITYMRRQEGSRVDRKGHVVTPKLLVQMALITYGGMAFTELSGMLRGGLFNMSLWQLNRVMYMPGVFLLCHYGLRGPLDLGALAKVVVGSAAYKALIAIWVVNSVVVEADPDTGSTRIPCATNHADSILFACAFVIVLAMVYERVRGRGPKIGLMLLPLLSWGMISNGRRLVWVQVALVAVAVYMIGRDNPVKRKIRRALLILAPFILGYLVAGWESKAGIFKPAQMVRSIVDPASDGSTMWREYENYDIIATIQLHPLWGRGYGNGYYEIITLPQIPYELELYAPHNSLLGLFCYSGLFAFIAQMAIYIGGVYCCVRAYHRSKEPAHRAAALAGYGSLVIYMVACWGDMGLGTMTGVFTVAPAIAIAGKLLVAIGDWGSGKAAKGSSPPEGLPTGDVRAA
jgi:hypothetical protein